MRKYIGALGAVLLLGGLPAPAPAQDLGAICDGLKNQPVGSWARYEVSGGQANGNMRLALLSQGAGGAEGPWFEMAGEINGQNAIIQIQADSWPFEPDEIRAVVMKAAGQPAMKLPESMLSQMRGQMNSSVNNLAESCGMGELLGTETIEVPAGSFETYKVRPGGDQQGLPDLVWVSSDIPFGAVRSEGSEGTTVLLEYGNDATSSIDEAPQSIPGMP